MKRAVVGFVERKAGAERSKLNVVATCDRNKVEEEVARWEKRTKKFEEGEGEDRTFQSPLSDYFGLWIQPFLSTATTMTKL